MGFGDARLHSYGYAHKLYVNGLVIIFLPGIVLPLPKKEVVGLNPVKNKSVNNYMLC